MEYLQGKGAQINVANRFNSHHVSTEDVDGLDEQLLLSKPKTEVFFETPKKAISYNQSPDIGMEASVNPYQGCEHGCIYCYARSTHEYWGFSAGLDFESKIIVKKDLPRLLEQAFLKPSYKPKTIMLSGNTDCYQPLEKKFKLTRSILELCNKYQNPVAIVTKNALVTRDLDILSEMGNKNLAQVIFSITSLDEGLRRILEPRTASAAKKFEAMKSLADNGVRVGVMCAPLIPSINHHELPDILKKAGEHGASMAAYTVVRLNGQIATVFKDWLVKNFPERADKVWNQIEELHGGQVSDSSFGRRVSGEGSIANIIRQLFGASERKYIPDRDLAPLDCSRFRRGGNYNLF